MIDLLLLCLEIKVKLIRIHKVTNLMGFGIENFFKFLILAATGLLLPRLRILYSRSQGHEM